MNTDRFDFREARRQCMLFGLRVALLWSGSFLCSMYAPQWFLLSWLGLGLGVYSLFAAARMIRDYNQEVSNFSLTKTGWMILITYFYTTLLTTLIQYVYFRFLDSGQLLANIEMARQVPAYRDLFQNMNWEAAKAVLSNPAQIAYSLFLYNALLGALLTLPTLLLAHRRNRNGRN